MDIQEPDWRIYSTFLIIYSKSRFQILKILGYLQKHLGKNNPKNDRPKKYNPNFGLYNPKKSTAAQAAGQRRSQSRFVVTPLAPGVGAVLRLERFRWGRLQCLFFKIDDNY